jgi:hypothetical protein
VCGCQERSGAGDDESSAPTPFPPAPKYEQELGAFKEWYPLDQRQTTTAKNEWNVCYNMADTHTHRLAFLIGTGRRSKNVPSPKFQPPESLLMTVDTHRQKNGEEGPPLFYIFPPFCHRREK